jgi:hypothetical protein
MGTVSEENMVIGFMVTKTVKSEIDRHAKMLRSRSEFIGKAIELCLDFKNAKMVEERLFARVMEAVGEMLMGSSGPEEEKLSPVQAVLSKAYVEQVDRFAEKMKLSRVNALAMLVEIGLKESALIMRTAIPAIRPIVGLVRKMKRKKAHGGGIAGIQSAKLAPWW